MKRNWQWTGPHGLETQDRIVLSTRVLDVMRPDTAFALLIVATRIQAYGQCDYGWARRQSSTKAIDDLMSHGMVDRTGNDLRIVAQKSARSPFRLLYLQKPKSERAAKAKTQRGIAARLRFAILERDGFRCRYCGVVAAGRELQVDHIIPVSRGGLSTASNLATACIDCNGGKSAQLVSV